MYSSRQRGSMGVVQNKIYGKQKRMCTTQAERAQAQENMVHKVCLSGVHGCQRQRGRRVHGCRERVKREKQRGRVGARGAQATMVPKGWEER